MTEKKRFNSKLWPVLVFALVLGVIVAMNVVSCRREEIRQSHMGNVIQQIQWMFARMNHAACDYTNDYGPSMSVDRANSNIIIREIRLQEISGAHDNFRVAAYGLSAHHRYRTHVGSFFEMPMHMQLILRYDPDPTIRLRFIADILYDLQEQLYREMPTRQLTDLVDRAHREINEFMR
jgi:hypothetical protein